MSWDDFHNDGVNQGVQDFLDNCQTSDVDEDYGECQCEKNYSGVQVQRMHHVNERIGQFQSGNHHVNYGALVLKLKCDGDDQGWMRDQDGNDGVGAGETWDERTQNDRVEISHKTDGVFLSQQKDEIYYYGVLHGGGEEEEANSDVILDGNGGKFLN